MHIWVLPLFYVEVCALYSWFFNKHYKHDATVRFVLLFSCLTSGGESCGGCASCRISSSINNNNNIKNNNDDIKNNGTARASSRSDCSARVNYWWSRQECKETYVSRFGLAVRRQAGKRKDLGSIPLRLSFLFKSCGLWTLSCDFVHHFLLKHRCPS